MESLLQPILESYSKYVIEKQTSPSYVEMYTRQNNEIITVYAKAKQSSSLDNNENNNDKEELDLTGSPLKLDLSLHTILDETLISDEPQLWRKEEIMHAPVDVEHARDILNLYNKSCSTVSKEDSVPMWVVCKSVEPKVLLINSQSNAEEFARGIVTYEGSVVLEEVDVESLVEEFASQEHISEDLTSSAGSVFCRQRVVSETIKYPIGEPKCWIGDLALKSAVLAETPLGRPTTSKESQGAARFRRRKTEACGSPCRRPMSSSGRLSVDKEEDSGVTVSIDCKYTISGISYSSLTMEEQLNAPHGGVTELHCEWTAKTLLTPFISCKVHFEQEVAIGHLASPCTAIWKSVTTLHNINQLLVDMTAAGLNSVNLETAAIRNIFQGMKRLNNSKRLSNLLNETETYTYTAECPVGGCICITEDTTTLRQCMSVMSTQGSSNDFTYKLWDILRDCETAEELITLLMQALKFISSGKIRPFIDVNNKSYLSKLVLKLSRGHSQTAKVLKNLRECPLQTLSLVAQVGIEKTMWEYTRVMSLLEHSFFIAGIWNTDSRSHESIEQINQTINDMTMGGDFTLNPFETIASSEHSIRIDAESFCIEDPNELTLDDFASLKKHGLVSEKKDVNEVPLIADEIDISPWKNLLMKFAQVHVCLEHLYRAEMCLRADFAQLKPIASKLLEHYVSEKSPIKTVGQLMSEPVQKICIPIANNVVQDHLKKSAFWYRMELKKKANCSEGLPRECRMVYVFSQQPVFPPPVWQHIDPPTEEIAEVTSAEELQFHCTKYVYLNNQISRKLDFLNNI